MAEEAIIIILPIETLLFKLYTYTQYILTLSLYQSKYNNIYAKLIKIFISFNMCIYIYIYYDNL
jgi:hypothetical protein